MQTPYYVHLKNVYYILIDQIFIKICTKFEQPWEWVCRKKLKPENSWLGLSYINVCKSWCHLTSYSYVEVEKTHTMTN